MRRSIRCNWCLSEHFSALGRLLLVNFGLLGPPVSPSPTATPEEEIQHSYTPPYESRSPRASLRRWRVKTGRGPGALPPLSLLGEERLRARTLHAPRGGAERFEDEQGDRQASRCTLSRVECLPLLNMRAESSPSPHRLPVILAPSGPGPWLGSMMVSRKQSVPFCGLLWVTMDSHLQVSNHLDRERTQPGSERTESRCFSDAAGENRLLSFIKTMPSIFIDPAALPSDWGGAFQLIFLMGVYGKLLMVSDGHNSGLTCARRFSLE
jgi:hypothetical protein